MSKVYSFSLQKVFDHRKRIEEKKAIDLSRESIILKNRMNEFDLLEEKKEEALNHNSNEAKNTENMELNNLKIRKDYVVQINNELTNQAQKVEEANVKVEKSREKLLDATKDKKILEKLNEHKYEEYKKDKKLEQNKTDNEISGRIALYNKMKESNG